MVWIWGPVQSHVSNDRLFLRYRLLQLIHPSHHEQNPALRDAKQSLHLCYFQLSQGAPLLLFCTLSFIVNTWFLQETQYRYTENGEFDVNHAYWYTYMWNACTITESVANDLHFYFLCLFSKRFRNGFAKRCLRKLHCCA